MTGLRTETGLVAEDQARVRALCRRAETADEVCPLNEAALLGLGQTGAHLLVDESPPSGAFPALVGYACLDQDASAQIVVDPLWRRRRVATALLAELTRMAPEVGLWSFGDLAPARAFCRSAGFQAQRELLVMEARPRPAGDQTTVAGVRIEVFTPERLDDLVRLNARVFADHPEQGRLTSADFSTRMAADWFDPNGLLIARTDDGALIGFVWVKPGPKTERAGAEIYVLGVDPSHTGRGVGRRLLDFALRDLTGQAVETVRLWVEADNRAAMSVYTNAGFSVVRHDFRYRRTS